jgi:hypothetical protein
MARGKGIMPGISFIKGPPEAAEEGGHGQVHIPVSQKPPRGGAAEGPSLEVLAGSVTFQTTRAAK